MVREFPKRKRVSELPPSPSMLTPVSEGEVTRLLTAAASGSDSAAGELLPLVYAELRRVAESYLRRERGDHTLQPTALVHEAYLRLVDQKAASFTNKAHFMRVAARAMRRVLVDHARAHRAAKRGGGAEEMAFDEGLVVIENRAIDMLALDEALNELQGLDAEQARIVELRFFAGLTSVEVSHVLGMSLRTVEREWAFARAWLRSKVGEGS